jgi:hypothetical protein
MRLASAERMADYNGSKNLRAELRLFSWQRVAPLYQRPNEEKLYALLTCSYYKLIEEMYT